MIFKNGCRPNNTRVMNTYFYFIWYLYRYISDNVTNENNCFAVWKDRVTQVNDRITNSRLDVNVIPFINIIRRFLLSKKYIFKERLALNKRFFMLSLFRFFNI